MPVQNFSHFGICVADPDRSMRFYRDILGFKPLTKLKVSDEGSAQLTGLKDIDLNSYFLEREGVRIELLHYISPGHEDGTVPRPMNRRGLTHIALRVEKLAAMLEQLEAEGFELMKETHISEPDFGVSVIYVLDPDGVRVELIEMPGDPKEALGDPMPG